MTTTILFALYIVCSLICFIYLYGQNKSQKQFNEYVIKTFNHIQEAEGKQFEINKSTSSWKELQSAWNNKMVREWNVINSKLKIK